MYCADCGTHMHVNNIFDRNGDLLGSINQCPKCKRVSYEDFALKELRRKEKKDALRSVLKASKSGR